MKLDQMIQGLCYIKSLSLETLKFSFVYESTKQIRRIALKCFRILLKLNEFFPQFPKHLRKSKSTDSISFESRIKKILTMFKKLRKILPKLITKAKVQFRLITFSRTSFSVRSFFFKFDLPDASDRLP